MYVLRSEDDLVSPPAPRSGIVHPLLHCLAPMSSSPSRITTCEVPSFTTRSRVRCLPRADPCSGNMCNRPWETGSLISRLASVCARYLVHRLSLSVSRPQELHSVRGGRNFLRQSSASTPRDADQAHDVQLVVVTRLEGHDCLSVSP